MGVFAETADVMESLLVDSLITGASREESVGDDKVGQFQQFLVVALD